MRFLRSRIIKRILGTAIVIGCSGIFLNGYVGMNEVHAQAQNENQNTTPASTPVSQTATIRQSLNTVLKLIYLLIRPLLVVAGLAMDNTLVYASVFHLDKPLREFRNMMKNFANFTLGFMVLFAIIKSIFSRTGAGSIKEEGSPLGVIKSTLIAGILIQASRFLVAALIDLSTVATYAVGGLPLSILKTANTSVNAQRIIATNGKIDLNKFSPTSKDAEAFQIRYTIIKADKTSTLQISPCRVERSYIVGREYPDATYNNAQNITARGRTQGEEVCVLNGNQLVVWNDYNVRVALQANACKNSLCGLETSEHYKAGLDNLMLITGVWDSKLTQDMILLDGSKKMTDAFNAGTGLLAQSISTTISDLIDKSKGFVGPLVTLYSSLLNFSQLSTATVTSASSTSFIFIIKSLVAVALFFPLIALTLVLIARVGILRLYIVASPFIILLATFKKSLGSIKGLDNPYLKIPNAIGIIFAPVVTVAALSISLVFMSALVNGFTATDTRSAIHASLGTTVIQGSGSDTVDFEGITKIEFTKLPRGTALDRLSWFMVNFFAIGLMRMIFFAALTSNELGKSIGGKVQEFGENFFKTLPVIPAFGGMEKGVGIGSAFNVLKNVPEEYISNKESKQESLVRDFMGYDVPDQTPTLAPDKAREILNSPTLTSSDISSRIIATSNVTADKVGDVLQGSTANLYAAINTLASSSNLTQAQKDSLITNVTNASNGKLGDNRYATEKTKADFDIAKNDVENMTKAASDEPALRAIFSAPTPEQKTKIDAYFTATNGSPYEVNDKNGKTYKITKTTATPPTYTVDVVTT